MSRTKSCNIPIMNSIIIFALFSSFHLLSNFVSGEETLPEPQKDCKHDDDCADFRMKCANDICVCSRLFKWDATLKECTIQLDELKEFLANLEGKDHKAVLDEEATIVFNQLGIAGVFAVVFGAVGVLGCVFTFCFITRMHHKKKKATRRQQVIEQEQRTEEVVPPRPLPPLPPEGEETEEKRQENLADGHTTGQSHVVTIQS